jgi:hypothetical protein
MNPLLFGREVSQRQGRAMIWRGRGWRIDVYPNGKTWRWHLCISHDRNVVVDRVSSFEHPSATAALRSVSAVVRGLGRVVGLIIGKDTA